MGYKLIPEFSLGIPPTFVCDQKELVARLDTALEASPIGRVLVESVPDNLASTTPKKSPKKSRDLQAEADEFRKLAKQLGCADDPFSAWETVALLMKEKIT